MAITGANVSVAAAMNITRRKVRSLEDKVQKALFRHLRRLKLVDPAE